MFKKVTTKEELSDAFSIRREVFVHEQGVSIENELDSYEEVATHIVGYAENGAPFAVARFRPYEDAAKVERVAIKSSYRQSGNGRQLMQFVEEVAQKEGYSTLVLNAQCQAEHFYRSLGYEAEGEVFLEENIEHIRMTKHI